MGVHHRVVVDERHPLAVLGDHMFDRCGGTRRTAEVERLRGIEYDGQDRSIDVRISRIRPKIGDDPENPKRIKTVRSKGYLFVKETSGI